MHFLSGCMSSVASTVEKSDVISGFLLSLRTKHWLTKDNYMNLPPEALVKVAKAFSGLEATVLLSMHPQRQVIFTNALILYIYTHIIGM